MALQGNHMPRLRGRSSGMERRLRILPFTRKPEAPDRALKAKLVAEGPGILRWLIEGCLAWQRIGLDPPKSVIAAGRGYFDNQDAFGRFVEEACILGEYLELAPDVLRKGFNAWAKDNGEEEMNGNAFGEAVDQFEPPVTDPPTKHLTRGRSNGRRWIRGIGLKPVAGVNRWSDP
jgi:putative DNA primase/helicase